MELGGDVVGRAGFGSSERGGGAAFGTVEVTAQLVAAAAGCQHCLVVVVADGLDHFIDAVCADDVFCPAGGGGPLCQCLVQGGVEALCWRDVGHRQRAHVDIEFGREDVEGIDVGLGSQCFELRACPFDVVERGFVVDFRVCPLRGDVLDGDQVRPVRVGTLA